MNQVKVARTHYHDMSPTLLNTFSLGIRDGVYVLYPAKFPAPPMMQADFEDIIEDFESTRTAFVNGGTAQKGPYTDALAKLMNTLDDFADMVDGLPNLNTATILESGFTATKETDSEHHVPDGTRGVTNLRRGDATGVIEAEYSVVEQAIYYHAFLTLMPLVTTRIENNLNLIWGEGESALITELGKSRKKTFYGLTPGVKYYVYYVIGNAQGVSQLTEGKSIMAA